MAVRTTIRLPAELLARAKRRAAAEGRTLTSLIEDGLRLIVTEGQKAKTGTRALPRISEATGGAVPGIEFDASSMLQELDDVGYIRRIRDSK